jgi:hypothetical protein
MGFPLPEKLSAEPMNPDKHRKYDRHFPYDPKGTFAMNENIEKKDFCLYPLKLKALDSALGLPAAKRGVQAETTDNQSFTIPGSYFMGSFTLHSYAPRIIASSLLPFRDNTGVE